MSTETKTESAGARTRDILHAMRWMGGDKLFGVVHVKGAAWANIPVTGNAKVDAEIQRAAQDPEHCLHHRALALNARTEQEAA